MGHERTHEWDWHKWPGDIVRTVRQVKSFRYTLYRFWQWILRASDWSCLFFHSLFLQNLGKNFNVVSDLSRLRFLQRVHPWLAAEEQWKLRAMKAKSKGPLVRRFFVFHPLSEFGIRFLRKAVMQLQPFVNHLLDRLLVKYTASVKT